MGLRTTAGPPDELAASLELRRTAGHKSSRRTLKTGWRTLPSTNLARYSISANKVGSTQMPR
jgi:hypothetical protein